MAIVNGHSAAKYNSLMEGGDIDRDQIVDGHLLPDEYFCPICRCLLWNPRSCASCQHLFCQKCIQTWLEYSKNDKTCPFRCQLYDERRCPPSFHSLLSRVKIHCRNAPFGCSEVLAYDSLERHENVECKYLTRTCPECMKLILVSEFIEHIQVAGNCIPCPIRCTICKAFIEKTEFRNHFNECYMNRFNDMFQQFATLRSRTTGQQEILPLTTEQRNMQLLQTMLNTLNSFEEQRQNSRLPTNLLGIDTIRQARERGCGHFLAVRDFIRPEHGRSTQLTIQKAPL
ncbi:unnamed protein product [Rotaria sordida]|uniref:RING-type domain-containing protein n=1 Tax=Rotaria sordida TaxID=392033 RepID=A0A818NQH0_9BILA|nr:unnamed protein product [Rotaria sordida]